MTNPIQELHIPLDNQQRLFAPLNEQTYARRQAELFDALDKEIQDFLLQDEEQSASKDQQQSVGAAIYHKLIGPNERTITGEMADWDVLERLNQLCCPCLFVTGTKDTIPYQEYESLTSLAYPHLSQPPQVFIQENADHGPFYGDTAREYLERIHQFLEDMK